MARYDRGWDLGYDRGYGYRRGTRYRGAGWAGGTESDYRSGMRGGMGGYDAGVYGRGYPGFGGYPGGRGRGMYYGGGYGQRPGRYGSTYDRGFREPGYGRDYAQRPFLPEQAYRRHPELDRPQRAEGGRWPDRWYAGTDREMDDDEIRERVEQNLRHDSWVDAARIRVEVDDKVVTLSGEVDDYIEARYAWDDAWETEGVRGVLNQLTVRLDEGPRHGEVFPQNEVSG